MVMSGTTARSDRFSEGAKGGNMWVTLATVKGGGNLLLIATAASFVCFFVRGATFLAAARVVFGAGMATFVTVLRGKGLPKNWSSVGCWPSNAVFLERVDSWDVDFRFLTRLSVTLGWPALELVVLMSLYKIKYLLDACQK